MLISYELNIYSGFRFYSFKWCTFQLVWWCIFQLVYTHQDQTAATEPEKIKPSCIELVVLEGAKVLISSFCKMLQMGGFDEALAALRKQAKQVDAL